jgi:heterodisulfide reductase subunit B
MTTYSYYPGCSLEGTSKEYDRSTRLVCQALGVELQELEDWNCCGASSGHHVSALLNVAVPARNLLIAEKAGLPVTVPCPACYLRLKEARHEAKAPAMQAQLTQVLGEPLKDEVTVELLLATLSQPSVLAEMQRKVVKPLKGLKPVSYYGCLMVRPPEIVQFDDPEDPLSMDRLLTLLGAAVIDWPFKTECCGGSLTFAREDITLKLSRDLLAAAKERGANCLVVACPLCHSNLDTRQGHIAKKYGENYALPIYYFTELMGIAFGMSPQELLIDKHLTEAVGLLKGLGLV